MLKRLSKAAIIPVVTELAIGVFLSLGAAGFSYAFVARAFLATPTEAINEESDALPPPTRSSAVRSSTAQPGDVAATTPRPLNVYPSPDSEVLGDGSDLDSSRRGLTETLIGWGFPVDGLLEVREDAPGVRARFLPLHNQAVQKAKLRAGKRYIWRVLASPEETGEYRQRILAGPFRFVLRGTP